MGDREAKETSDPIDLRGCTASQVHLLRLQHWRRVAVDPGNSNPFNEQATKLFVSLES